MGSAEQWEGVLYFFCARERERERDRRPLINGARHKKIEEKRKGNEEWKEGKKSLVPPSLPASFLGLSFLISYYFSTFKQRLFPTKKTTKLLKLQITFPLRNYSSFRDLRHGRSRKENDSEDYVAPQKKPETV